MQNHRIKKYLGRRSHGGVGTLEYIIVVLVLALVFTSMAYFLPRTMAGRWKSAADTFGLWRQYDPQKTLECGYYQEGNTGYWFEMECFKTRYETIVRQQCSSSSRVLDPADCRRLAHLTAAQACRDARCCDQYEDPSLCQP